MKTFKGFIKEGIGSSTDDQAVDDGVNITDVGNPEVVKRLSAYVGQVGNQEYLIPEHAVNRIRASLERIGFTFSKEVPTMEGKSGSFELPMSKFGGRFGKDSNTPFDEFLDDDGISHMVEGGLSLKISYEMMPTNNSCRVFASIA
tara:strand:+ start:411 stop:845 length:435 start_codon:yes stop_codon:yes gene_type:complete